MDLLDYVIFLTRHLKCFIAPIRLNGSSVESIFSCLKYIANGNLSSSNYAISLSSLITQRDDILKKDTGQILEI